MGAPVDFSDARNALLSMLRYGMPASAARHDAQLLDIGFSTGCIDFAFVRLLSNARLASRKRKEARGGAR